MSGFSSVCVATCAVALNGKSVEASALRQSGGGGSGAHGSFEKVHTVAMPLDRAVVAALALRRPNRRQAAPLSPGREMSSPHTSFCQGHGDFVWSTEDGRG